MQIAQFDRTENRADMERGCMCVFAEVKIDIELIKGFVIKRISSDLRRVEYYSYFRKKLDHCYLSIILLA